MTPDIANFVYLDGRIVKEEVIGVGGAGIVVNRGGYAFKIPRISKLVEIDGVPVHDRILNHNEDSYNELAVAVTSFRHEKAIYKRLGDRPGIIRCYNVDSEEPSIQMPLMNGDLRQYLSDFRPERTVQLSWFIQLARAMAFAHTKGVILCDLRLDNIVYDDKLIDFSESSLMHPEWDLKGCYKYGFSILTDIGQFGAVMFEITTGQRCSFDIYEEWQEVGDRRSFFLTLRGLLRGVLRQPVFPSPDSMLLSVALFVAQSRRSL
ncbi:uncharacterized protein PV06_08285 [Exophiala oligosperma]|uniref:Protein kinase domain-containing protein n=1 Tax=Exophiala oligosperma TaxID=215243 RepID=A0A0D2DB49_9EURO|nr:uncharacterized protein PV06_08285 [Exophiala oligosperma]KIW39695.1 hypothetical protein PV06_08285 [Exophiala oligosperma]